MSTFLAVCFTVTGVLHAEPPRDAEAIKKDLEKFQGRWAVVRLIEKGKVYDPKGTDFRNMTLVVKNDKLEWKEETESVNFVVNVNPAAKPSTIDLTVVGHPDLKGTNYAIYKFVDDELWIALGTRPKPNEVSDRPPNFDYQNVNGPRAKFVLIFKQFKK